MVKSIVIIAVFSMLFNQFIHVAVLDTADAHQNPQNVALNDTHHHSHNSHYNSRSHGNEEHDDDHGLGSLHNALHDLQNIAHSTGSMLLATTLGAARQTLHGPDIYRGISISPPVPPPLT